MNAKQRIKPLLIGLGNRDRGDDQAGIYVAEKIQQQLGAVADVMIHRSDPAYLIDQWQGREFVIAVDAVVSDTMPEGEIFCWNAANEKLAVETCHTSTHNLGIHDAIELAKALGKMLRRFYVFGINARTFTAGQGMSRAVHDGAEKAANEVTQLLMGAHNAGNVVAQRFADKN